MLAALRAAVASVSSEMAEKNAITRVLASNGFRRAPAVVSSRVGGVTTRVYLWSDAGIALVSGPSIQGTVYEVHTVPAGADPTSFDLFIPGERGRPAYAAGRKAKALANPAPQRVAAPAPMPVPQRTPTPVIRRPAASVLSNPVKKAATAPKEGGEVYIVFEPGVGLTVIGDTFAVKDTIKEAGFFWTGKEGKYGYPTSVWAAPMSDKAASVSDMVGFVGKTKTVAALAQGLKAALEAQGATVKMTASLGASAPAVTAAPVAAIVGPDDPPPSPVNDVSVNGPGFNAYLSAMDPASVWSEPVAQIAKRLVYKSGKPGGGLAGGIYTDSKTGKDYLAKFPPDPKMIGSEVYAAHLYRAVGVFAPDMRPAVVDGKPAILSPWIDGLKKIASSSASFMGGTTPEERAILAATFPADIWLADYDVVGLAWDNLLRTPAHDIAQKFIRIDPGASIMYRASGAFKHPLPTTDAKPQVESMLTKPMDSKVEAVFLEAHTHPELMLGVANAIASLPVSYLDALAKWSGYAVTTGLAPGQTIGEFLAARGKSLMAEVLKLTGTGASAPAPAPTPTVAAPAKKSPFRPPQAAPTFAPASTAGTTDVSSMTEIDALPNGSVVTGGESPGATFYVRDSGGLWRELTPEGDFMPGLFSDDVYDTLGPEVLLAYEGSGTGPDPDDSIMLGTYYVKVTSPVPGAPSAPAPSAAPIPKSIPTPVEEEPAAEDPKPWPVSPFSFSIPADFVWQTVGGAEALAKRLTGAQLGPKLGSFPGGKMTDPLTGKTFYVKFFKSDEHAYTEALASHLYRLLGVNAPDVRAVPAKLLGSWGNGYKAALLSPWMDGYEQVKNGDFSQSEKVYLREAFPADVWLANYDVVGKGPATKYDNLLVDTGYGMDFPNYFLRVDQGAALDYRSTGSTKKSAGDWSTDAAKTWGSFLSSQNPTIYKVFDGATPTDGAEMIQRIGALVAAPIFGQTLAFAGRPDLAPTLQGRAEWLAGMLDAEKPAATPTPTPAPASKPVGPGSILSTVAEVDALPEGSVIFHAERQTASDAHLVSTVHVRVIGSSGKWKELVLPTGQLSMSSAQATSSVVPDDAAWAVVVVRYGPHGPPLPEIAAKIGQKSGKAGQYEYFTISSPL